MLLRDIQLDTSLLDNKQMDYYVQMQRAASLFNLCINKATIRKNAHLVISKRGRSLHITTRLYHFFEEGDPDRDSCSVEMLATDGVRFLTLNLLGQSFELADFYRPSHNISAKDYEFIIAAKAIETYARPWCENRGDKKYIMGEIHDFLEDYAG